MFVMKSLFMICGVYYYYYIIVYHKLSNEHSVYMVVFTSSKWEVHQYRMNAALDTACTVQALSCILYPHLAVQAMLTRRHLGEEVRSRLAPPYIIVLTSIGTPGGS